MINLIMRFGLWWHKRKVLVEVRKDIQFLDTYKRDLLDFNEDDAREQLSAIHNNEGLSPQEKAQRKAPIEELIADSNAVRKNYQDSLDLEKDIMEYIKII